VHGVGAEASPVERLGEEEIDSRMPVHLVLLLVVLDQPDQLALDLDREGGRAVLSGGLRP
jgi:hypothetical protein